MKARRYLEENREDFVNHPLPQEAETHEEHIPREFHHLQRNFHYSYCKRDGSEIQKNDDLQQNNEKMKPEVIDTLARGSIEDSFFFTSKERLAASFAASAVAARFSALLCFCSRSFSAANLRASARVLF